MIYIEPVEEKSKNILHYVVVFVVATSHAEVTILIHESSRFLHEFPATEVPAGVFLLPRISNY